MKTFIVFIIGLQLSGVLSKVLQNSEPKCTVPEINPCMSCTDDDRYNSDPKNSCYRPCLEPTSFIECDSKDNMSVQECEKDLVWSQEDLTCVWPDAIGVLSKVLQNSEPKCTVPEINPCMSCTDDDRYNSDPKNSCYRPCLEPTSFIECDSKDNMSVQECEKDLVWSQEDLTCVWPDAILQKSAAQCSVEGNPCYACTDADRYGNDPNNSCYKPCPEPTTFIQCGADYNMLVVECMPGLVWSQSQLACVWPTTSIFKNSLKDDSICNACTGADRHNNDPYNVCFQVYEPNDQYYIACDNAQNAFLMECPKNLVWSQSALTCVREDGAAVTEPCAFCSTENYYDGNPNNVCFLAYPGYVGDYVMCNPDGSFTVQHCANGLIWSEEQLTCVWFTG